MGRLTGNPVAVTGITVRLTGNHGPAARSFRPAHGLAVQGEKEGDSRAAAPSVSDCPSRPGVWPFGPAAYPHREAPQFLQMRQPS